MDTERAASERLRLRLARAGAVASLAAGTLGLGFWLGGRDEPPPVVVEIPAPAPEPEAPRGPRAVALPLDQVGRLVPIGGAEACALGGRRLSCTTDGGSSWGEPVELPDPPLAVVRFAESLLVAAVDGMVYQLRAGAEAEIWAAPPGDVAVVDATARDGTLWLLAHRYDPPADELHLPTVAETVVYTVGGSGSLERRGSLAGYGGERILVEPDGAVVTWAPFDLRAWRSKDSGRSFRRLSAAQRFGADFGGLQVAVERRADRLPGPGRKARPASALLVSRDGGSWETVLETPGEILVDFADAATGAVIARGEGLAQITRDGGVSFEELWRDDRLDEATALAHVDGSFLAATGSGVVLLLPIDETK